MTVLLSEVARAVGGVLTGADVEVATATHDSRAVVAGALFCAIVGTNHDGHDHVADAVAAGAVAALVERDVDVDVSRVRVPNVRRAAGPAAAVIHGHPSRSMDVIGVTGTNGKTTVTWMLEAAIGASGRGAGVIGTIGARVHGEPVSLERTTPEGPDFQRLLATMRDRGVEMVATEVSSHALDLHRVDGTWFRVAAFTNLTQDHLDHHGDMETYYRAKRALFTAAFAEQAVIWIDDEHGARLATETDLPVTSVGTAATADAVLREPQATLAGGTARLEVDGGTLELATPLLGGHNLANAAVAAVAAIRSGLDAHAVIEGIAAATPPPGRLERVDEGQPFTVLVDYAHTPDAVAVVVDELRQLLPAGGRLHVVVGAGGDRDATKRGPMGAAAARADHVVATSDNPRSEDPQVILEAVVAGARGAATTPDAVEGVLDRREAIRRAFAAAAADDIVLIAGKGHEQHQELADRVVEFDDRVVAAEELRGLVPS
ncbi:MAG: UDP-N-acetylmuramoyl-L-alanyl-D-glutamate--2,6-diaminopimelate ligase [Nitriliruptorales bacterium]|nr:UDP-N-acetylmuramoyl-L-alanyl-D-glutamate--2,6-diaminopimelate ligase [Nitriliruptorales bacterium]